MPLGSRAAREVSATARARGAASTARKAAAEARTWPGTERASGRRDSSGRRGDPREQALWWSGIIGGTRVESVPGARLGEHMDLFDLSGKTALVTGGTRGIGLMMARGLL